jgi:hypothetical protein
LSIAIRPPGRRQLQAALVVGVVARLVGIDEGEVEAPGLAGCDAGVEGGERGPEPQVDLVGDAGRLPERSTDRGVGVADVAGEEVAVGRQRERHRQRAVAGEDTHLDAAARADQPHQQRHQLALLRTDLHAGMLDARGSPRAERAAAGISRTEWANQIRQQRVVEGQCAMGHGSLSGSDG